MDARRTGAKPAVPVIPLDVESPVIRSVLVGGLRKGFVALAAIAARLGSTTEAVEAAVEQLRDSGYNIVRSGGRAAIVKDIPPPGEPIVELAALNGPIHRFGVLSDTHLCNKHQRLDLLEEAYNEFAKAKIATVYHAGNIVDGHAKFNRYELLAHGATDQAMYCLDHYPQRRGITTKYIIGTCHEGWWFAREGLDFGRYLAMEARERGRKDLVYLGCQEASVKLRSRGGDAVMTVFHPAAGTSYAISYQPQKIVESLQGGEKPAILAVGHFHKLESVMVRNVRVIQAGCMQDQTRWMRGKHIEAHLGFYIVECQQDAKGAIRKFTTTEYNRYDRKYHFGETQ